MRARTGTNPYYPNVKCLRVSPGFIHAKRKLTIVFKEWRKTGLTLPLSANFLPTTKTQPLLNQSISIDKSNLLILMHVKSKHKRLPKTAMTGWRIPLEPLWIMMTVGTPLLLYSSLRPLAVFGLREVSSLPMQSFPESQDAGMYTEMKSGLFSTIDLSVVLPETPGKSFRAFSSFSQCNY